MQSLHPLREAGFHYGQRVVGRVELGRKQFRVQPLGLTANEVLEPYAVPVLSEEALSGCDDQGSGKRMRTTVLLKGLHLLEQLPKEGVGAARPHGLAADEGNQVAGGLVRFLAQVYPVGAVAPGPGAFEGLTQGAVIVRGPAADDQAVVGEDIV